MTPCCPHPEEEHHVLITCQEVTHYPSEDYPCLCAGYASQVADGQCERCGHPRRSHAATRVCRPANAALCGCHRPA